MGICSSKPIDQRALIKKKKGLYVIHYCLHCCSGTVCKHNTPENDMYCIVAKYKHYPQDRVIPFCSLYSNNFKGQKDDYVIAYGFHINNNKVKTLDTKYKYGDVYNFCV